MKKWLVLILSSVLFDLLATNDFPNADWPAAIIVIAIFIILAIDPLRTSWIASKANRILSFFAEPITREELLSLRIREFIPKSTVSILIEALDAGVIDLNEDLLDIDLDRWNTILDSCYEPIESALQEKAAIDSAQTTDPEARKAIRGRLEQELHSVREALSKELVPTFLAQIHEWQLRRIFSAYRQSCAENWWTSIDELLDAFNNLIILFGSNKHVMHNIDRAYESVRKDLYVMCGRAFGESGLRKLSQEKRVLFDLLSDHRHHIDGNAYGKDLVIQN